jgi:P-type Cu2+ transporter
LNLRCADPAAESLLRLLAGQALSRAGGAPLVPGNAARILKDAGEHYPVWLSAIGTAQFAITLTITVFVIACPDALGLATPMAIMIGTGRGAQNGILIKNASALENATRLDVLIFDKTGTLTLGKPEVVEIVAAPGRTETEVLALAAGMEQHSEHPLAHAILEKAKGLQAMQAERFTNVDGMGARASSGGEPALVGAANALLLKRATIEGLKGAL